MTLKEFTTLYDKVTRAQKACEIALGYLNNHATEEEIKACGDSLAQIGCACASLESFFENINEIEIKVME